MAEKCAVCGKPLTEGAFGIGGLPKKYRNVWFCSQSCGAFWRSQHRYELEHFDEIEAERAKCNGCGIRMNCTRYLASIETKKHYKCERRDK